MSKPENPYCLIREGLFLEPCWGLLLSAHEPASKRAGLHVRRMTSFVTRQPSRTYAVIRHDGKDYVLNYCPFCGKKIDEPMLDDNEAAA